MAMTRAEHDRIKKAALDARMRASVSEQEYRENKEYTCPKCDTARHVKMLDRGRLGCTQCHSGWTPRF
jgi:ribosomal protein L37AE/L43A